MKLLNIQVIFLCTLSLSIALPIDEERNNAIYGKYYQGDIILSPEQSSELSSGRSQRTGIINARQRWPKINGKATIPYVIDSVYNTDERNKIRTAMNDIESKTCVRFVQRAAQADFIRIFSKDGCWSYVGRMGGQQDLSLLKNGCIYHGTIMHELIHAIGYGHMHQHWDRDSKVRINWENISDGNSVWFEKLSTKEWYNFGTPYDISSIMHYGSTAFSKNGRNTIQALNSADQSRIGGGDSLSSGDIQRIKNMYAC